MPHSGSPKTWIKIVTALYILKILQTGPAHGNNIAEQIRVRTCNALSPNPNFIYPLLKSMEDSGYIAGEWEKPGIRGKKVYRLTDKGREYLPQIRITVQQKFQEIERRMEILRSDLLEM
jgi:DNA-binding PadR family transcriptional regulator